MGHIVVTLACDCGRSLHLEGHSPAAISVTASRLLSLARAEGWTRDRGVGWRCPVCARVPEATP
jgi:hypothetical protein